MHLPVARQEAKPAEAVSLPSDDHACCFQVADQLGVERIGPQHQAGSDSLLTSATFMKLVQTQFTGLENALKHNGVLFGLGTDGEREMIRLED